MIKPTAAQKAETFQAQQVPESMPKNPMMSDPGIAAMQRRLAGAKKQKPMKMPMPRQRAQSQIVKKAM